MKHLNYICKNFYNIDLNSRSSKMLNFWQKEFDQSINKHINFLKSNLENQNIYSSKFSQILQEMDIFQTEDNEEDKKDNQSEGQTIPYYDQNSDLEDQKDENTDQETEANLTQTMILMSTNWTNNLQIQSLTNKIQNR